MLTLPLTTRDQAARKAPLYLFGGKVAYDAVEVAETDLEIDHGVISAINTSRSKPEPNPREFSLISLQGCLVLPGLINAHDHLEFGIFPRLGAGPYADAKSWATDIYRPEESPIHELLRVSKSTRLFWGGLRNLFSGVTTVCHHNPYDEAVFRTHFPVRVMDSYRWVHSLDFFSATEQSLEHLPENAPFQIHLGEGTGKRSRLEIYELDKMGLLHKDSVLIHGVAFEENEWKLIRKRGASVIWCPSSNLFTLGKTLKLDSLSRGVWVGIGNDSPLTAEGDLLDEIRVAAQLGTPADKLYAMVTDIPAGIFRLRQGEGKIRPGGIADFLIVTDTGETPAQRLLSLTHRDIQLMIRGGEIVLASEKFVRQSETLSPESLQRVSFDKLDWWTSLDVQSRWNETSQILGSDLFLAGKNVRI
jgi:cytosine/adenosine deaminase-related metal-dependent hydrolase